MKTSAGTHIGHIFIYTLIGLLLLGTLTLSGMLYLQHSHLEQQIEETGATTYGHILQKVDDKARLSFALMGLYQNDPEIIDAFKKMDRTALLHASQPIFEHLKRYFEITHLHFHQVDKTNFLRLHNPPQHSDRIDRAALQLAKNQQQDVYGLEFGAYDTLILWAIRPWVVDGELLGYLEIGEEVGHLFPQFSDTAKLQTLFLINKDRIKDSALTEQWMSRFDADRKLTEAAHYFVINSNQAVDSSLINCIDSASFYEPKQFTMKQRSYSFITFPITDIQHEEVGAVAILIDIDEETIYTNRFILTIGILGAIVASFMLLILRSYIRRIQIKINQDYDTIHELSIRDSLTGLYNRRQFDRLSPKLLNQARRLHAPLSFTMLDIDHFKLYNDTYGHLQGDQAIREVAQVMQDTYRRDTDYLFRIGGEEFAVISLDCHKQQTIEMAEKLRNTLCERRIEHVENGEHPYVTVSIGTFSQIPDETIRDSHELYKQADAALYHAKQNGRNRVEYTDES